MKITIGSIVVVSMFLLFSAGKLRRTQEGSIDKADKEIMDAIKYAYGLEEVLWDNERKIKSKADVFNHFISGFSAEKAKDLANYFWMEGRDEIGEKAGMLRVGDPVLMVPDSVEVLSKSEERAEALLKYKAIEEGPVTYKSHSVRVKLRKENEIWKIYEADVRR
jgi:hypothetical protein